MGGNANPMNNNPAGGAVPWRNGQNPVGGNGMNGNPLQNILLQSLLSGGNNNAMNMRKWWRKMC